MEPPAHTCISIKTAVLFISKIYKQINFLNNTEFENTVMYKNVYESCVLVNYMKVTSYLSLTPTQLNNKCFANPQDTFGIRKY